MSIVKEQPQKTIYDIVFNSCINIYKIISTMQRKKICRYFEKGSCKKSNCPFVHLKETRKNCQFYMQGYCKKGDLCNFYHPPKERQQQEKKQFKKQTNKNKKQQVHADESSEEEVKEREDIDQHPEEKLQEKQTHIPQQKIQQLQKMKKINYLLGINSESQQDQQQQSQKSIQQIPSIQFFKVYPKKFPDYSKTPQFKEFVTKNQDRYFKGGYMNVINKLTDPGEKQHYQIIRRFQDSFRQSIQSPRIYTINIKPLTYRPQIQLCFPIKQDTIDLQINCTNYPKEKASIKILNQSIPQQFKEKIQSYLKNYHSNKNLFETLKLLQNNFEKIYEDCKFKLQNEFFSRKELNKKLKKQQQKQSQQTESTQVRKKNYKKKSATKQKQNPHATVIPYKPGQKPDTVSYNYDITVQTLNIAGCQYVIVGRMLLYVECVCENQIMIILEGNEVRDLKVGVRLICKKCQVQIRLCMIRQILQYKATTLGKIGIDNGKLLDIGGIAWRIGCQCDNEVHMNKIVLPGARTNMNCHSCFKNMSIIYNGLKHFNPFLKEPQIQAEKQLPNKGCCKHMKLSFRKFRYACCGRIFSCDQCHEIGSIIPHEFVHGITMLCGFCSFEQPVSQHCINCKKQVLKGVLKTGHWQGGLGCRDQTQLSRHDAKKYSGLTKKKQK